MSAPLVGHLDPAFIAMMEDVKALLRFVFATGNTLTFPVSGTGSAGMEACIVNLVEPGDAVVVGVNGVFGTRMADVIERAGGVAVRVEAPWGRIVRPEQVEAALRNCRQPKLVALVHAETSTGAWQPLADAARLAHEHGALFLADCVTSLGGAPVEIDGWGIDAAYSGTQKCLSCPPGLAPITFGPRALEALHERKTRVQSWYLDLTLLSQYWGEERVYHHTAPISMNYALREALRLVAEEGLEARFARHRKNHEALAAGLGALGLALAAEEGHRLPMLNAVTVPEGVDEARLRARRRRRGCDGGRSAARDPRLHQRPEGPPHRRRARLPGGALPRAAPADRLLRARARGALRARCELPLPALRPATGPGRRRAPHAR